MHINYKITPVLTVRCMTRGMSPNLSESSFLFYKINVSSSYH